MKTIYKYPLIVTGEQIVSLPEGFKPLSVQFQRGQLVLWCEVDTDCQSNPETVFIVGTGHPMPSATNVKYVSTVQDGPFVWHVYITH